MYIEHAESCPMIENQSIQWWVKKGSRDPMASHVPLRLVNVGGDEAQGPDAVLGPYTGDLYEADHGRPGYWVDPKDPERKPLSAWGVKVVDFQKKIDIDDEQWGHGYDTVRTPYASEEQQREYDKDIDEVCAALKKLASHPVHEYKYKGINTIILLKDGYGATDAKGRHFDRYVELPEKIVDAIDDF